MVAIYTKLVFEAIQEGCELPFSVYTTRLAALKFAKASLQEEVQYCENELKKPQTEEDTQQLQEELTENQRLLKAAASMVKREQNNKGYTDLMVDGAPSPHQSDTTLRWLIDRLRS